MVSGRLSTMRGAVSAARQAALGRDEDPGCGMAAALRRRSVRSRRADSWRRCRNDRRRRRLAASSVARASSSSRVPYQPTRPMQPKPMGASERRGSTDGARRGAACRAAAIHGRHCIIRASHFDQDARQHDHRLPRALHHGAAGAAPHFRDAQIAALKDPGADAVARVAQDQRRPDPRQPRERAAEAAARARLGRHDILAARVDHGASHRQRGDEPGVVADQQRPDRPRRRSLSEELRRRVHAAAVTRRVARRQRQGAGALREDGLHRRQPESRSVGRQLERRRR